MTMDALKVRVRDIVEDDWRGQAKRLLEDRKTTGKGDVSSEWLIANYFFKSANLDILVAL
jgi:hypothetical protein